MATLASADAPPHVVAAPLAWGVIAAGVLLAWGWVVLAQQVGATITIESQAGANALFYLLLFVPLVAIGLVAARFSQVQALRLGSEPARWSGVGLGLGVAGLLATLALSWLQGGLAFGSVPTAGFGVLLLGIVLTLFQTGVEEVFFRGWLQPALGDRLGPVAAVGITALCFAAFHLAGGARAPVSLVNIVLAGVFFGVLAWRSGGIVAPVLAHFAWNMIESWGLGLVPNPGNDVFGSLFDLDLLGAPIWGGQEEGLNASIGTSAVLLALIVPLAWRPVAAARAGVPA